MFRSRHFAYRVLSVLLIGLFSLSFGSGCKKKKGNDVDVVDADPWLRKLNQLADTVPADASSAFFVVDFSHALAAYQGFRTRVSAYMNDFSSIEADLRNTLGVDPARPQNLVNIGIDPQGGAVCSVVQNQPLCGAILADGDVFTEHFSRVLQSQPFNLRAPIVQTDLPSGGQLLRFATEEGAESKAALVRTSTMGYLILRPRAESIEGLAATLEAPAAQPLRTHKAFDALLEHTERESILAWLSPNASAVAVRNITKLGNRIPSMDNIEGVLIGVKISADAIHGWFSAKIDPDDQRVRAMLERKEGVQAADFSKLVTNDAYMLMRARTEPSHLIDTLRAAIDDEYVETAENRIQGSTGTDDFEQRLTKVLGSDMMIVATRARLLTLASLARGGNVNARALGDGLGLIMAYQLADEAGAKSLLTEIAAARPENLKAADVDESLQQWTVQSGPGAGTILVVMDGFLVATTERQRSEVIELLRAERAPSIQEISAEEALNLRKETEDIGLFIDLKRVANNAIGQIAGGRLSPSMREAIQVFNEFWMRANVEDQEWLDGTYRIQLSTPARL